MKLFSFKQVFSLSILITSVAPLLAMEMQMQSSAMLTDAFRYGAALKAFERHPACLYWLIKASAQDITKPPLAALTIRDMHIMQGHPNGTKVITHARGNIMNIETGQHTKIPYLYTDQEWHPDGRHILLQRHSMCRETCELQIWDTESMKCIEIIPTITTRDSLHMRWSPDGTKIALFPSWIGQWLAIYDRTSKKLDRIRQYTHRKLELIDFQWHPNNSNQYFTLEKESTPEKEDGKEIKLNLYHNDCFSVLFTSDNVMGHHSLCISPDGKKCVVIFDDAIDMISISSEKAPGWHLDIEIHNQFEVHWLTNEFLFFRSRDNGTLILDARRGSSIQSLPWFDGGLLWTNQTHCVKWSMPYTSDGFSTVVSRYAYFDESLKAKLLATLTPEQESVLIYLHDLARNITCTPIDSKMVSAAVACLDEQIQMAIKKQFPDLNQVH